jgi:hypothetical protein
MLVQSVILHGVQKYIYNHADKTMTTAMEFIYLLCFHLFSKSLYPCETKFLGSTGFLTL